MRITYPKPIKKARKYRISEATEMLWLIALIILAIGAFAVIMRSLPLLIQSEQSLSSFTDEKLSTYEADKTAYKMRQLYDNK